MVWAKSKAEKSMLMRKGYVIMQSHVKLYPQAPVILGAKWTDISLLQSLSRKCS